jgi:hypothetical protein
VCTAIESQIRRVISRNHGRDHGFVMARSSLMEIEGLMVSGPGSVDRHFGHTAPEGKEHTWIVVRINRNAITAVRQLTEEIQLVGID